MTDGQRTRGANVPLTPFYGNRNEDFAQYIKQFTLICDANNYAVDKRAQILGSYLRDKAFYIYDSLTDAEKADFNQLTTALSDKFQTTDYRRFAHQKFQERKQHAGETVADYACELHTLGLAALTTIATDQRDTLIRENFIAGLLPQLRELIIYSSPKSFNEALTLAERLEGLHAGKQDVSAKSVMLLEDISGRLAKLECGGNAGEQRFPVPNTTFLVERQTQNSPTTTPRPTRFQLNNTRQEFRVGETICYRCNRTGHIARNCPRNRDMSTVVCRACNRLGHFARNCQRRGVAFGQRANQPNFNRTPHIRVGRYGFPPRPGPPNRTMAVTAPHSMVQDGDAEEQRWQPLVGAVRFTRGSTVNRSNKDSGNSQDSVAETEDDSHGRCTRIHGKKSKRLPLAVLLMGMMSILMGPQVMAERHATARSSAPMVCQAYEGKVLWKLPSSFNCPKGNHTTAKKITPVEMKIYKRNYVQYKTKAWKCVRMTQEAQTFTYFFGDENLKKERKHPEAVSAEDCTTMKNYKTCRNQPMIYSGGVYQTTQKMNWHYPGGGANCCHWKKFTVTNCYMYETHVYKRHDNPAMESTAGDVANCVYQKGQCVLAEGAFLLWDVSNKSMCSFLPWKTISGKRYGTSWLSDDSNLALTFTKNRHTTDCLSHDLLLSDQGIAVRPRIKGSRHVRKRQLTTTQLEGLSAYLKGSGGVVSSSQLAASLQALEFRWQQNMEFSFSHALNSICNFMRSVVELLKTQVLANPAMAIRSLTNQSDIFAKSGGNVIEIFPCTKLRRHAFRLQPMNGTCTAQLPIKFKINNKTNLGYLDPLTNIIHRFSVPIDCHMMKEVPVQIEEKTYLYQARTGHLTLAYHIPTLKVLQWNIEPIIDMKSTIFHEIVIYTWSELQTHISLNDIMGGLERQRAVLRQMGINANEEEPEKSAENAVSRIMGLGYFGFLHGLMANFLQILTFLMCLYVTVCFAIVHCVPINSMHAGLYLGNVVCRIKNKWQRWKHARAHGKENVEPPGHAEQMLTTSDTFDSLERRVRAMVDRGNRRPLLQIMPLQRTSGITASAPWDRNVTTGRKRARTEYSPILTQPSEFEVQPFRVNTIGEIGEVVVTLAVERIPFRAVLDSGSQCTLMSGKAAGRVKKDLLTGDRRSEDSATPSKVITVSGQPLTTLGASSVDINFGSGVAHGPVIVVKEMIDDVIVGIDLLRALGPIPFDFNKALVQTSDMTLIMHRKEEPNNMRALDVASRPHHRWVDVATKLSPSKQAGYGCIQRKSTASHAVNTFAGANEMVVSTYLEGMKVRTLIDTGSSLTIIPEKVARLFRGAITHENIRAVSMTGHPLSVIGELTTSLRVGSKDILGKVVVVKESPYELIIGIDLMKYFGTLKLNFGEKTVGFGTERIPMIPIDRPADVFLCQQARIPPKTALVAMGLCYGLTPESVANPTPSCFVPSRKLLEKYEVLTQGSIVQPNDRMIPITLSNPDPVPKFLPEKATMGSLQLLEKYEINAVQSQDATQDLVVRLGPSRSAQELTQLAGDICLAENLTRQDRAQLQQIITCYERLFARNDYDLGKTHLIEHSIDTMDARPISQRPYRTPHSLRPYLTKKIEK